MSSDDQAWLDAAAGRVVRPYALTQGRTRHSGMEFDLIATVTARRPPAAEPGGLAPEHIAVLRHARTPATVADIAADIDLPLGVVRVLLADLRELGLVVIQAPMPSRARQVDRDTLREVLHGLRAL